MFERSFFDKLCLFLGISLLLIISESTGRADEKSELTRIYSLYNRGSYSQALEGLAKLQQKSIESDPSQMTSNYWSGLCHSRMQAFDKAIPYFEKARSAGGQFHDLDYEMGQAYYANQQLRAAREAFKRSAFQNFKIGASLYYVGFISQLLEDYVLAKKAYLKIQTFPKDPEKVKQASLLQLAELELETFGKGVKEKARFPSARGPASEPQSSLLEKDKKLPPSVLTSFQKVVSFDPTTPVAVQAMARIEELIPQTSTAPSPTALQAPSAADKNLGPVRPWSIKVGVSGQYDTNVITKADEATIAISDTSSPLLKSELNGRYEVSLFKRLIVAPTLDITDNRYSRNDEPLVYQNNNISVVPALRNRFEYKLFDAPAATHFDFEFNYMMRNWQRILNQMQFFSRYYGFSLGQRMQFFSFGSTILTGYFKLYRNQNDNQSAMIPSVTLTQNVNLSGGKAVSFSLSYNLNRARNEFYDRADYRMTTAFNLPNLIGQINFAVMLDFTLVDTMNQSYVRGMETTLNPSLIVTRNFSNGFYLIGNFNFTRNISQDVTNYAFSRQVAGLGCGYRF
jgi:hypothetical protein